MAQDSFQERTEKATPKRKQEARRKGNIPRSNEVNSAMVLLVASLFFLILGKFMFKELMAVMKVLLANISSMDLTSDKLPHLVKRGGLTLALLAGPFMMTIFVAGVASNIMQAGLTFSAHSLEPKLEKLNPIEGFKRMFAMRSLVELVKNLIKMGIIGFVGYRTLRGEFNGFIQLLNQDVSQIVAFVGVVAMKLILRVGVVFAILAVLDFLYQRYEYEKNLKMTKQEIKEEHKQMEGDPLIKSRIRAIQRERARHRMLQNVPKADVVVTNPTHYAVALKYDPEKASAPVVVAKGIRKIALKIKEIAQQHNVPVVERPLVARMLYKSAEVGNEIPVELYQVVAEILAHVYKMKKKSI
ncbi:flagellar biosynthesis protein FlhB [candidate division KSB1 bacterium RBG_16_48_16]|nr:MAG: flagellar biosynthesis protein FlhB [candidate division KSB1 bacterium RBG_16_48_16]